MGSLKGSTVETTETPDGAHVGKSGAVEVPGKTASSTPMVEVAFGAGFTEPTKPYGNVKFYAQIKIQCEIGEQDDIMDFAEEWVDGRLAKKMAEVQEIYSEE